jgi:hypothetical protein
MIEGIGSPCNAKDKARGEGERRDSSKEID